MNATVSPASDTEFHIFDLSAFETAGETARDRLAAEVDKTCRTTGFLATVT